jgi:hypothetical protein
MSDQEPTIAGLDKLFGAKTTADGLGEEDASKDAFFVRVAEVAEEMIARHGKDFAMGVLVLSAKFIAEDKPLIKREVGAGAKLS